MKEYKAQTEEEAVAKAAEDFRVSKEELQYEVTQVVKSIFKNKRSVTIACKDLNDLVQDVTSYINSILSVINVEARHSYTYDATTDIIGWTIKPVREDDAPRVIGYQGNFLRCLNVVCRALIQNKYNHNYRILLDCDGYKNKKYDRLERMAKRLAHEVQHTQQAVELPAMTSDERRIVHNVIAKMNYVQSASTGVGKFRHVTIKYDPEKIVSKRKRFNKNNSSEAQTSEE